LLKCLYTDYIEQNYIPHDFNGHFNRGKFLSIYETS